MKVKTISANRQLLLGERKPRPGGPEYHRHCIENLRRSVWPLSTQIIGSGADRL